MVAIATKFVVFDDLDDGYTTNAPTVGYDAQGAFINNVRNPIFPQMAATKAYVDAATGAFNSWKPSVRFATAGPLDPYTYDNGLANDGVGATLTSNDPNTFSLDGNAPNLGDRVLIKDEATLLNNPYNGIYLVTDTGSFSTSWILTRAADSDSGDKLLMAAVFVSEGDANANSAWVDTATAAIATGTTSITFVEFAGSRSPSAGKVDGLYISSEAINVGDPVTPSATDDEIDRARGDTVNKARPIGVAVTSAGLGGTPVEIVSVGLAVGVLSGATAQDVYYMDPAGGMSTTLPSSGNRVVQMGIAKNTTDLWVRIQDYGQRS